MFRSILISAASAALVLVAAVASAAKNEEPVASVQLAPSWESAIDEAKTLVLPIVVHHHGFYCGPCWGMHASVMCNEKYIEFAAENTVEVIALQDLEKGIDANDRRAATYDGKDAQGRAAKFFVEFPGLTKEQLLALHASKASSYNDTGGIPFTVIVDPFTLAEMKRFPGGGIPAKNIMESVLEQRKTLASRHGAGISRAKLTKVTAEVDRIAGALAKSGIAKSLADYRKLETSVAKEPDALRAKLEPAMKAILEAAAKELDAAESAIASGDMAGAKKILGRLGRSLEGTDLASRAAEIAAKLN